LQAKARERTGERYRLVVIRETGLEGFWMHPCLIREGIASHVVEAASIAASRRSGRAKTDKPDGEALVRTVLAYTKARWVRLIALWYDAFPQGVALPDPGRQTVEPSWLHSPIKRLIPSPEPDPT
jgi:hypothetical protein